MAHTEKSFKLRYVGSRFDDGRLPVEVLSDLPAFRNLVIAFAKGEWKRIYPDRQRVPKGFDRSIAFDLVGIEGGSAVTKLDWNRDLAQARLPEFSDELADIVQVSVDQAVRLLDEAGSGRFPNTLSTDHVRALNQLGSGLREGERIEFQGTVGGDGNVVYLDAIRRKRLITHVKETYQTRVESVGVFTGTSTTREYVTVRTDEYDEIEIPVDPEKIVEVFDGSLLSIVQFDVQIELDNKDGFRRVVEVFDIGLVDAEIGSDLERCRTRLDEIRRLSVGWDGGNGAGIEAAAIEAAMRFVSKRLSLCGSYRIYPTEVGGVLFEFENNGWDLSVEFAPDGHVELYGVEIEGSREHKPQEFGDLGEEFMKAFDKFIKL